MRSGLSTGFFFTHICRYISRVLPQRKAGFELSHLGVASVPEWEHLQARPPKNVPSVLPDCR